MWTRLGAQDRCSGPRSLLLRSGSLLSVAEGQKLELSPRSSSVVLGSDCWGSLSCLGGVAGTRKGACESLRIRSPIKSTLFAEEWLSEIEKSQSDRPAGREATQTQIHPSRRLVGTEPIRSALERPSRLIHPGSCGPLNWHCGDDG